MLYYQELENALSSDTPTLLLRELALDLNRKGLNRKEIYEIFYAYFLKLQSDNRDDDANIIGDVMDMITGWFSPYNIDIPD
jgi:hypothetical protein